MEPDVLSPNAQLLIKLGSLIVHAEEFLSPHGHPLDKHTFDSLMKESDVIEWMRGMDQLALLPRKRNNPDR